MWVMSKYGFYSATVNKRSRARADDEMKVRARCRRHLEQLQAALPDREPYRDFVRAAIREEVGTDYRWWVIVDRMTWSCVVDWIAEHIDYGNFKSAVGETGDLAYERALHAVWREMLKIQEEEER